MPPKIDRDRSQEHNLTNGPGFFLYAMTVQFMSTPRPSSTHWAVSPEL